jgi:hypothetical protein
MNQELPGRTRGRAATRRETNRVRRDDSHATKSLQRPHGETLPARNERPVSSTLPREMREDLICRDVGTSPHGSLCHLEDFDIGIGERGVSVVLEQDNHGGAVSQALTGHDHLAVDNMTVSSSHGISSTISDDRAGSRREGGEPTLAAPGLKTRACETRAGFSRSLLEDAVEIANDGRDLVGTSIETVGGVWSLDETAKVGANTHGSNVDPALDPGAMSR